MALDPQLVLMPAPGLQLIRTHDQRLLVRHPGGITFRPGFPVETLHELLRAFDGQRTVAEVVATLSNRYEEGDLQVLLEQLHGDILVPYQAPTAERPRRAEVLIWGEVQHAAVVLKGLAALDIPATATSEPVAAAALDGYRLFLGIGGGRTLQACFDQQAACLAAGLPSLWFTGEAGWVHLSSLVVPGVSPCLACSRLAAFSEADATSADRLRDLGQLRGELDFERRNPQRALAHLLQVALNLLRHDQAQTATARSYNPLGKIHEHHLSRRDGCPLCGKVVSVWSQYRFDHLQQQFAVLTAFTQSRIEFQEPARPKPRRLGVIGGGTAGYLAALALRRFFPQDQITLLESSAIPIIGVGEATTPLLPQFLHADLGLDPVTLFAEVAPTFKLGIQFCWGSTPFFYPFGPLRLLEPMAYDGHLGAASLQGLMMNAAKVPAMFQPQGELAWLPATQIAYHLDNRRFAAYLGRQARAAGVQVIDCELHQVATQHDQVQALTDTTGQTHAFDFYVDCSGFRSMLLGEALGSPFLSFGQSLFTDYAVVGPVSSEQKPRSYTRARAMDCGWCWDIPQADERHLGYVFSSAFTSPAQAEAEMRHVFPALGQTRLIPFKAGRRQDFIKGNVAALGNAYGFVEPLESTSLHLLVRQIGLLRQFLQNGQALQADLAALYNQRVGGWWDYLRWFLALHYRFNHAQNTPFWKTCQAEVDVSAYGELLDLYRNCGPLSQSGYLPGFSAYPDPLWGPEGVDLLLMGQGVACPLKTPKLSRSGWNRWRQESQQLVDQLADHGEVITELQRNPRLARKVGALFSAAGPAFPP